MLGFARRPRRRTIPYGMFDHGSYGLQAKNARVLERLYHKGNKLTWDGKEVLSTLIAQHGRPALPREQRDALGRIFSIIMWGELAAWRISAELADEIEPLEAKMAATSQAFDEARHFYVMHDYLVELDALPDELDRGTRLLLEEVMNADHLAKKLLGMQLMVEPIALTLFHIVKRLELEPVLTHLLPYYERDEARHVALGIQYLPAMLTRMSTAERLGLWSFQMRLLTLEILQSTAVQRDLMTLGVDPRQLLAVGRGRQLQAFDAVFGAVEGHDKIADALGAVLVRYVDTLSEAVMPLTDQDVPGLAARARRVWRTLRHGSDVEPEGDLDPHVSDDQVPLIQGLKDEAARSAGRG